MYPNKYKRGGSFMEKTSITLELAGQNFQMSTSENSEYIISLGEKVNARIKIIQDAHPNMSLVKCTLLALLNTEDELVKVRENYEILDSKLTRLHEISRSAVFEPIQRKTAYKKPVDV